LARALLIGCGCSVRGAGRLLLERGWAVRGTSRATAGLEAIEAAGIEPAEADPDRVGSLVELIGDVTVVAWLLGSPEGGPGAARRLHLERLPSLLEKLVDTPVRGLVYEAQPGFDAGTPDPGAALVTDAQQRWRIPARIVAADRSDPDLWAATVADAVEGVVGLQSSGSG